ncbi:hypothetical protein ACHHV8_11115 [Paenibacillus sp. TAB 01]|uniref:hypothetical protein n=1 Tax=Paenibacillus sp. TAB 01 TaxID=3368988 RepID=UPI00375243C8
MQDKVTYRFQSGTVEVEIVRQGDYPVEKIKEEIKEIEQVFANSPAPISQEQFKEEYVASWGVSEKEYRQYAEGDWNIKNEKQARSESQIVAILKEDNKRIPTLNHMDDVLHQCCTAAELYGKDIPIMSSKYIHDFHRKAFNIRTEDNLKYYDMEREYKCLIRALGLEDMPFLSNKTFEEFIVYCYYDAIDENIDEWDED